VRAGARRRFARWGALALVGALAVVATGCASRNSEVDSLSATYGLPSTRVSIEAEDWLLVPTRSSLPGMDHYPVTLTVADDRVSGTAPCNTYRGDFRLDGDSVDISHVAATAKACRASVMGAETRYLASLTVVTRVHVTDDRLTLTNDHGVRLKYRSFDATERLIGEWPIVNVTRGTAIEGVVPGTDPSVTFHDDGNVTLATGCNTASGSWALDGDQLTVDPLRQTRKSCPEPEGVTAQEASLTKGLESAARVEVAPRRLTILNGRGEIAIVAIR
jgi:heat shock protein HslJ